MNITCQITGATITDEPACSCCGRTAQKYSSGRPECWPCWNYRKLDRPAALHWAKVLLPLFANVDYYDQSQYFPDADAGVGTMLENAEQVLLRSMLLLRHGPEHTWEDFLWAELNRNTCFTTLLAHLTEDQKTTLREMN